MNARYDDTNTKDILKDVTAPSGVLQATLEAYSDALIGNLQPRKEPPQGALDLSEDIYKNVLHHYGDGQKDVPIPAQTEQFQNAKNVIEKLLNSEKAISLRSELKITKLSENVFDVDLAGIKYRIDTKNDTIKGAEPKDKTAYSLSADKDGNIVIKPDSSKDPKKFSLIKKDGSTVSQYSDEDDPEEVHTTECPAHGTWVKTTIVDTTRKEIVEHYSILDPKKPFKDAYGSEVEFKPTAEPTGKVVVKTADGKTYGLFNGTLTITEKDGTSKEYGRDDGKQVSRYGGSKQDRYVEFPGGVVANVGYGGGAIEIKNSDGTVTRVVCRTKDPHVTITTKKPSAK